MVRCVCVIDRVSARRSFCRYRPFLLQCLEAPERSGHNWKARREGVKREQAHQVYLLRVWILKRCHRSIGGLH
jgi:hypothetical protein